MEEDKIIIYQTADGEASIDVKLENETVWLSQAQMAVLFDRDRTVIGRHIRKIFQEGELEEDVVCAKIAHTTPHGAVEGKTQEQVLKYYNLDVVISVGYRVKSLRGTQFRIWATHILKDYLVKGYAINEQRVKAVEAKYDELKEVVRLIGRTVSLQGQLSECEQRGLLSVITDYVYARDMLDRYDYQQLTIGKTTRRAPFRATYENAMEAIQSLKDKGDF